MIYKGTSVSLLLIDWIIGFAIVCAFIWLLVKAIVFLLILLALAVVAFLLWWAWLEIRDHRRRVLSRREASQRLYPPR